MSWGSNKLSKIIPVNVFSLNALPVQARNISPILVQIISKTAKQTPESIQPILVGRVNEVLYAVNDFEVVLGLQKANIKKINAYIVDYSTMQDLIISHVRKNFQPQTIDPLKIHDVIRHMVDNGTDHTTACKLLWLDKRPELSSVIRAEITTEARQVLLDMVDEISKKIYYIVTPIYYVQRIAKISKSQQHDAALELKSFTMPKMINAEKYSWPSLDTVISLLGKYTADKKIPPTADRIGKYGLIGDLAKPKTTSKPASKVIQKAAKYIATDPDLVYVPIKGAHPDLLMHKKTGRVAKAEEKNGAYTMTGDLGKSAFVLPEHAAKYLDAENNDKIIIHKYSSLQKAQRALAKAKTLDAKCVILSVSKLPLR